MKMANNETTSVEHWSTGGATFSATACPSWNFPVEGTWGFKPVAKQGLTIIVADLFHVTRGVMDGVNF